MDGQTNGWLDGGWVGVQQTDSWDFLPVSRVGLGAGLGGVSGEEARGMRKVSFLGHRCSPPRLWQRCCGAWTRRLRPTRASGPDPRLGCRPLPALLLGEAAVEVLRSGLSALPSHLLTCSSLPVCALPQPASAPLHSPYPHILNEVKHTKNCMYLKRATNFHKPRSPL